ncbi:hypothetical protein Tco_1131666, partial [Tanacetum coccineum]
MLARPMFDPLAIIPLHKGHQHVSQPTAAVGVNRYAISDGGAHGDAIHAANADTYDSVS